MNKQITPDQLEEIGQLADQADNLAAGSRLPMADSVHVPLLRSGLLEIRDALRNLYIVLAGDDPWDGPPQ